MISTTSDIAKAWSHTTAEIPTKGLDTVRNADAAQRTALAAVLEIPGIERLHVSYRIEPAASGRYRLTGQIRARVVQACVVTLDPVVNEVTDNLQVEFRPAGTKENAQTGNPDAELPILDAEEFEPIEEHRLAVGRVVAEALAATLPRYPRAADAALEQHEAGPAAGPTVNPFAALAGWKPKPE